MSNENNDTLETMTDEQLQALADAAEKGDVQAQEKLSALVEAELEEILSEGEAE